MKKIKILTFILCIAMLVVSLSVGLVACNPKPASQNAEVENFYISLSSENWNTYNNVDAVPTEYLLTKDDVSNLYKLEIELAENIEFFINKVGSDDKYGYSALFTSNDKLAQGTDGSLKVAKQGKFTLTFDPSDKSLSYVFISTDPADVTLEKIELDKTELTLNVGDSKVLTATVTPTEYAGQLVWSSDNEEVATVSQNGVVTAIGQGSATIIVKADNDKSATCVITVTQPVKSLILNQTSLVLAANGQDRDITISFSPFDATDMTYEYTITEGSDFITVTKKSDNILNVKGVAEGNAKLKVTSNDDKEISAVCDIQVRSASSPVAFIVENKRIMIDDQVNMSVSLENAQIKSVNWSVANQEVATISGNKETATVTGVAFGKTVITAVITDTNDSTYTVACNLLVADDYYFIYGYGLGSGDWYYQDYIADQSAARKENLLLDEIGTGLYALTRYLTPDNGFQIIFPSVASYVDEENDGKWNKNIPSELVDSSVYYDASRSDTDLIDNQPTYFRVKENGVYTIYLDLTGTSAKVYIKQVSLDIREIVLTAKEGSPVLQTGESLILQIESLPIYAAFTKSDLKVWLSSSADDVNDYLDIVPNFAEKTITVTVKKAPTSEIKAYVCCDVKGITAQFEIAVLNESGQMTPATSIKFVDENGEPVEHYYFNVNNGEGNWSFPVYAQVNDDATIKAVKYSIDDAYQSKSLFLRTHAALKYSVGVDSGIVTGHILGTVEVWATSVSDENVKQSCLATFYSDTLYLAGEVGELTSFEALTEDYTAIDGTIYAPYKFTMNSYTSFTLEKQLDQYKKISVTNSVGGKTNRDEYGFQIVMLGINENWDSALTNSYIDKNGSYNFETNCQMQAANVRILRSGIYVIEVDLSGVQAYWTINYKSDGMQEVRLSQNTATLKADESVDISLELRPLFIEKPAQNAFSYELDVDSKYIDVTFDYDSLTYSIAAKEVDREQDIEAVITFKVNGVETELALTLIAEHHFVLDWNDSEHFYRCTDDGCGLIERNEPHKQGTVKKSDDPRGHYYLCTGCGKEFDFEEHKFALDANGWHDGTQLQCECGFDLYTVDGGTIVKYNGRLEKIRIPSSINGVTITTIGRGAFRDNTYLKQVTIPTTITTLQSDAFAGTGLISVQIPSSVQSFGASLFQSCESLESVMIEKISKTTLDMFKGCVKLSNVIINSTSIIIGEGTFEGCSSLKQFDFSKVLNMGARAFAGTSFVEITLDNIGGTPLGRAVFRDCTSLKKVTVGENLHLTGYNGHLFENCTSLEYVFFKSEKFWKIEVDDFKGCTAIKAVYIGRNYQQVAGVGDFIASGNECLEGKMYARSTQNTPTGNYGAWSKYFAGNWNYDDTGIQTLDHVVVLNAVATTSSISQYDNAVLYCDDRKGKKSF